MNLFLRVESEKIMCKNRKICKIDNTAHIITVVIVGICLSDDGMYVNWKSVLLWWTNRACGMEGIRRWSTSEHMRIDNVKTGGQHVVRESTVRERGIT